MNSPTPFRPSAVSAGEFIPGEMNSPRPHQAFAPAAGELRLSAVSAGEFIPCEMSGLTNAVNPLSRGRLTGTHSTGFTMENPREAAPSLAAGTGGFFT
jgi:hypothetical protein